MEQVLIKNATIKIIKTKMKQNLFNSSTTFNVSYESICKTLVHALNKHFRSILNNNTFVIIGACRAEFAFH